MQDGYIFSDTIERNIATGDKYINKEKLNHAVKVANIESFVEELPLGFNTKIGAAGNGISGGHKQRILIARAVYKILITFYLTKQHLHWMPKMKR